MPFGFNGPVPTILGIQKLFGRLVLLWACVLTPLLVWRGGPDMFEQPKQFALKLAAAVAVAAGAVGTPGPLALPLLFILVLALPGSLLSPLPLTALFGEYTSYQGWLHWLALAVLALSFGNVLARGGEPRRFLVALSCSLLAVSAYAVLQLAGGDPASWSAGQPVTRAFSTAGNPLYLGFTLAAGLPVPLALALASRTLPGAAGWLCAAALVAFALLASGSRSALAGGMLGVCVTMLLAPGAGAARRGLLRGFAPAALAVLVIGALLLPAERNPFPLLGRRLADAARGNDPRPLIWAGAARLTFGRPLIGQGLDTFATLHPQVQSPRLWDLIWHASPEKAHNELAQAAATAGLPAAGALLWAGAVLAALALRGQGNVLSAGAAGGLAALLVPACFGFMTCPAQAVALPLVGLLAAVLPGRSLPRPAGRVLAAILFASLVVHLHFMASEAALKSATRTDGAGMDRALALRTPWAQRLLRTGDALEHAWFGAALNAPVPAADIERRLVTLERIYGEAMRVNPLHAFAHSDLARVAMRRGRFAEAEAGYARARELAPRDAYLLMEEAQTSMAAGREDRALELLDRAAAMYPGWGEPPGMAGYLWMKRRRPDRAEPFLRRAVEGDWHGNTPAAYAAAVNLASLYRASRRWTEAVWAENQAQRFAPTPP